MDNVMQMLIENRNTPYDLTFKNALFEYYKCHNYSRKALYDIARRIDIKPSILKVYLYSYAEEKFGMDKSVFDEYIKLEQEKNEPIFIKTENIILDKKGIKTSLLWNNEDEKKYVLKIIYKYSRENNFSIESTREMASKLNISQSKYLELIEEYVHKYSSDDIDEEQKKELSLQKTDRVRVRNEKLRNCYTDIINSNDPEEIEKIVEKSGYAITYIKQNFELYTNFFNEEEKNMFNKKYAEFRTHHTEYLKNIRDNKKKELEKEKIKRKLEVAEKIIKKYLYNNNKSYINFLYSNNITNEEFNEYLSCIENNDLEFYLEYSNLKDQKKKEDKKHLEDEIRYVANGLKNGVDDNGKTRAFDIIDYLETTNIPVWRMFNESMNMLNKLELLLFKKFKLANKGADEYNSTEEKMIKVEKRTVGVQLDKFGRVIEGTGRIINDDEKTLLLQFLNDNNVSINRKTYNAALKRYLNGFINFEKEKTLQLSKKEQ